MKNRKALKNSYKARKFKIGVAQIRNTINDKIYIESSLNLDAIWNRHKFQLRGGLHLNTALQKEWNQFGEDHFVYEILREIKQDDNEKATDYRKEAKRLEAMLIEKLQPFGNRGYHVKKEDI